MSKRNKVGCAESGGASSLMSYFSPAKLTNHANGTDNSVHHGNIENLNVTAAPAPAPAPHPTPCYGVEESKSDCEDTVPPGMRRGGDVETQRGAPPARPAAKRARLDEERHEDSDAGEVDACAATATSSAVAGAGAAEEQKHSRMQSSQMNACAPSPRPALTASTGDRALKTATLDVAAKKFDFIAGCDDPRARTARQIGKVFCIPCSKQLWYRPNVIEKHQRTRMHVAAVARMASPQGRLQTHLAQHTGADMTDEEELAKLQALLVAHLVRDVKLNMNQIDKMFDQSSRTGAAMTMLFSSRKRLAPAAVSRQRACAEVELHVKELSAKASAYTLQVDESPTELADGRKVVVFSAIFDGSEKPVVVDVKPLVASLDAEQYMRLLREVVTKLGDARKFVALATDNCATMLAFARKACAEYPAVVHVGCLAHIVDRLLARATNVWGGLDVIASKLNALRCHRDFRCREDARRAGIRLASFNYCATRWSGHVDTMSALADLDQWQKLRAWLQCTKTGGETVAACKGFFEDPANYLRVLLFNTLAAYICVVQKQAQRAWLPPGILKSLRVLISTVKGWADIDCEHKCEDVLPAMVKHAVRQFRAAYTALTTPVLAARSAGGASAAVAEATQSEKQPVVRKSGRTLKPSSAGAAGAAATLTLEDAAAISAAQFADDALDARVWTVLSEAAGLALDLMKTDIPRLEQYEPLLQARFAFYPEHPKRDITSEQLMRFCHPEDHTALLTEWQIFSEGYCHTDYQHLTTPAAVFAYWQAHAGDFPVTAQAALRALTVPISTADVERVFSQQTHMGVDWHRNIMQEKAFVEELRLRTADGSWFLLALDEQIKIAEKTWVFKVDRIERDDASGSCSSSSDEESDADE